jgi:hypothetical protein
MTAVDSAIGRDDCVVRTLRSLGRLAGSHPLVPWLLAAAYATLGLHHVLADTFLNDEGMLSYFFAGLTWDAPLDTFFWQKSRPLLALFYAPAAAAGLSVFLVVHVVVAALAGPLAAAVARAWDHRYPNLAAALVLASPLMLAAGPAGVSNTDAVVLALFAVWLAARERPLPAGLVLGALLLIRAELAALVLAFGALGVVRRPFRPILLGVAVVPVVYWLLGILYHHDALWPLLYPPTLASPSLAPEVFEALATSGGPWTAVPTLIALTPAVGLALLARWRKLPPTEWTCLGFTLAFLLALRILPYFGIFNFGSSPRYILPALPFVALLASRTFTRWHEAGDPRWSAAWLAGLLVVAHFADTQSAWPWLLLAVAAWSVVAALAAFRRTALAAGLAVVAAVAPVPWLLPTTDLAVAETHPELAAAMAWLADHPRPAHAGPVYTNMHLLATGARRAGVLPGIEVRQLVQFDQLAELTRLTNPHVGQRRRILALLEHRFYATPVLPDALRPERMPDHSLFVLVDDRRLELVMPAELWRPHLEPLAAGPGWRILALRPQP